MKPAIKTNIVLILTALLLAACSSTPQNDPYGDADSQRSRSKQAQDEMSRDTSR